MVPAVEEVQNGRIQKREVLQTDIQEVQMMVILHMEIKAHLYTIYSRYSVVLSPLTHVAWFSICMGMQSLIICKHLNTVFIHSADLWKPRFLKVITVEGLFYERGEDRWTWMLVLRLLWTLNTKVGIGSTFKCALYGGSKGGKYYTIKTRFESEQNI